MTAADAQARPSAPREPCSARIELDTAAIRNPLAAHVSERLELPIGESLMTIDHLIRAEQAGKHDHGLVRVHYLTSSGKFGPYGNRPAPSPERREPGRIHLDGQGHLGYPLLHRFVQIGCEEAESHGTCIGTTTSVYPSGALCDWARMAIRGDVGVIMTASSPPRMASPTGTTPIIGTNPLCIGLPADPMPFVSDASTSALNHGELLLARASGQPLPPDSAIGPDGLATTDAGRVDPTKGLGALLPLGSSHKWFSLALALELLSSLGGNQPGSRDLRERGVFCLFLGPSVTQSVRGTLSEWLKKLDASGTRIPGWESCREARRQRRRKIVRIRPATFRQLEPWLCIS